MLEVLRRPLPPKAFLALLAGAASAVAIYCLGYTWLAGHPETVGQSFAWATVNIAPWIVAIELGKRAERPGGALSIALAAATGSMAIGYALGASDSALWFEAWRRVPPLLASLALIGLLRSPLGSGQAAAAEIPLLPRQIDWVRAAGNYVELRAAGRTIMHRSPLSAIEQQLAHHGFVRIHRSLLVRRDRIARVRSEDLVLADGTHLKIGKRYRAALAA